MPIRRSSYSFSAALPIDTVPSSLVPGDGEDGRDSRLTSALGGEGPDGVSLFRSRVLFAFSEYLNVISISFEVLYPICNPTDVY